MQLAELSNAAQLDGTQVTSQQIQLAKLSSAVQLDSRAHKRCAVAFVQPWLIDRRKPPDESPAVRSTTPNEVAHPNINQVPVSPASEIWQTTS